MVAWRKLVRNGFDFSKHDCVLVAERSLRRGFTKSQNLLVATCKGEMMT
jgi:hypothetical protein